MARLAVGFAARGDCGRRCDGADEAMEGANLMSIPWIQLIAAFGVGSILAAIVGWWSAKAVAISNHRQNWINALRDDIATFLKEIDLLHFRVAKMARSGDTDDLEKQQDLRASALLVYRRIRLRLNMTETPSVKLAEALNALMTIDSTVADADRVEAVIQASGIVLKQEWAVTKYGMFTGLMRFKNGREGAGLIRRWLNAIGLSLGIIGVVIIFLWGPPQPSFERGVSIGLEDANVLANGRTVAQHDADNAAQQRHYKLMSQTGLALILVGFMFQLANEFLPHDMTPRQ